MPATSREECTATAYIDTEDGEFEFTVHFTRQKWEEYHTVQGAPERFTEYVDVEYEPPFEELCDTFLEAEVERAASYAMENFL